MFWTIPIVSKRVTPSLDLSAFAAAPPGATNSTTATRGARGISELSRQSFALGR